VIRRNQQTVNERVPRGKIRIDCTCCQLPQHNPDRDGAIPAICDDCYQHRGRSAEKRLARAESHETMLSVRLAACRESEARAQRDLATAKERVANTLASRGALADRLVEAAETDRRHNCQAQQLGRDPEVVEFARKHHERQGRWKAGEF
jgi:hypothetical protein